MWSRRNTDGDAQRRPAFQRPSQSLGSLITQAIDQFKELLRSEVELAKLKAGEAGKKFAGGIAFVSVAGLAALALFWWLFHSIELAFALILPEWAAALVTAGILLLLVIICGAIGALLFKKAKNDVPDVKAALQEDVQILKEGLGNE